MVEAVAICDLLRKAVTNLFEKRFREQSEVLTGKTAFGDRRKDQHQHAHYLAFSSSLEDSGRIDTLAIWAPSGWGEKENVGITSLRYLRSPDYLRRLGKYRLGLEVLASEKLALPELIGPSKEWISITPYVPGRSCSKWTDGKTRRTHVKKDIERELRYRDRPPPNIIEEINQPDWKRFRRARPNKGTRGRPATSLRLAFEHPIEGPLALGALSHFGLGLFIPLGVNRLHQ